MHAAVTVKPSLVVSQREEETVTLPLAGVHVIMGPGGAAPVGLGSPARGGHHLRSKPLGHWDAVTILRDHLLPVHLTYCYHLSSLRRNDRCRPRLNVDASFMVKKSPVFWRKKRGSHKRGHPPPPRLVLLRGHPAASECGGPHVQVSGDIHPCLYGTCPVASSKLTTLATLPDHFYPCSP